jgi:hypothetical protein
MPTQTKQFREIHPAARLKFLRGGERQGSGGGGGGNTRRLKRATDPTDSTSYIYFSEVSRAATPIRLIFTTSTAHVIGRPRAVRYVILKIRTVTAECRYDDPSTNGIICGGRCCCPRRRRLGWGPRREFFNGGSGLDSFSPVLSHRIFPSPFRECGKVATQILHSNSRHDLTLLFRVRWEIIASGCPHGMAPRRSPGTPAFARAKLPGNPRGSADLPSRKP